MLTRSIQNRIDAAGLTRETAIITACGHVFNCETFGAVLKEARGMCPQCTEKINRPHIWGPCLPFYVWKDEILHIKHMLGEIEKLSDYSERILRIRKMFEFMLNTPGFLASAASCKFGIALQKKIEEIRSKKCKPLHPVIACVEAALRDESLRFSSLS
jgi:hypothetical protein